MQFETTVLDEFYIIGISVRTANANGQAQADIGALWSRFFNQNIISQIPDKVNNDLYCVYTDYESDYQGPYTTVLGCKVQSLQNIPDGLSGIPIPAANYQVYTSQGKLPDCVGQTWHYIWQHTQNRKYTADFDVYGPEAQNPEAAIVKTYLSITA
ncbi:AraC family transcriptional regulator [Adhaeribacter swui]|uniref:AraC family transcriptional regulator n=1 Tax=Adhaeribacter swui TaxID=2086471 RepID=A0A7G7G5M8_9BACT|nr:GyrI-like domain-containing protein [Adhaeribacter swui]QNF32462.1 AraC family transcriptional regulator [Adhaeribacter swui]